jgi:KaiC/GvpD/RAD55 family RecA-like ATPase
MRLNKIPTGIKTFDVNINGGFPAGSVILLLEDVGAGAREFLYTSIFNVSQMKFHNDNLIKKKPENLASNDDIITTSMLPDKICYVSVSKSQEDILKENACSFHKDFYNTIKKTLIFKELSDIYFRHSIVQNFWISDKKRIMDFDYSSNTNILEEISAFLDEHAENNIIIIDSLTDLMMYETDYLNKNDIIMFLKGMVRISKTWDGLIYILLTANILEKQMQEIINDVVDGVLVFEWFDKGSVKMQRNLYLSKFRGLIPQLEQKKIAKFETKVTYDGGFEVSNVKKIM